MLSRLSIVAFVGREGMRPGALRSSSTSNFPDCQGNDSTFVTQLSPSEALMDLFFRRNTQEMPPKGGVSEGSGNDLP
jgi:hypothetical protein